MKSEQAVLPNFCLEEEEEDILTLLPFKLISVTSRLHAEHYREGKGKVVPVLFFYLSTTP
jgi:hypothetical protein